MDYRNFRQIVEKTPAGVLVHIREYLDLQGTRIAELPAELRVDGAVYLKHTLITELPTSLHVKGSLYLGGLRVTTLPTALYVGNYLDIRNTLITDIPAGIHVGRSMHIQGTGIAEIPADLQLGERVYLDHDQFIVVHTEGHADKCEPSRNAILLPDNAALDKIFAASCRQSIPAKKLALLRYALKKCPTTTDRLHAIELAMKTGDESIFLPILREIAEQSRHRLPASRRV